MTSQSGHTEYLNDLNTRTPSVVMQNDMNPPSFIFLTTINFRVFHHMKIETAAHSKWPDLCIFS